MAIIIKKGLETDRISITPRDGELIYTTDDKLLYMGDGTTVGGNIVQDITPYLPLIGGTVTGPIKGVMPTAGDELTIKDYVDTKEPFLPTPGASNLVLTSDTLNVRSWKTIIDGVSSVNTQVGDVVLDAADVGAAWESHGHTISEVQGLQGSLDSKLDDDFLETDIRYFKKLDHVVTSTPNSPITLDSSGKIAADMMLFLSFTPQGNFTPVAGDITTEYPVIVDEPDGSFWVISGLDDALGYVFVTGNLAGRTIFNGELLISTSSLTSPWMIYQSNLDGQSYLKTDGSNSMVAPLRVGGNPVINVQDPDPLDTVNFQQSAVTVNYMASFSQFFVSKSYVDDANAAQDLIIADKPNYDYVDDRNSEQDQLTDLKASIIYVDDQNNLQDIIITGKSDIGHIHVVADISDFPVTMPPASHNHPTSQITGLDSSLATLQNNIDGKAWENHGHLISEVQGLQGSLDGKESFLGNPDEDGKVLSSTIAGVRSWVTTSGGVTDHTLLTNIGINTHDEIDTHIALVNNHIDWTVAGAESIETSRYDNSVLEGRVTTNETDILANTTALDNKLSLTGGTVTGNTVFNGWVDFSGTAPTTANQPIDVEDLTRKDYVDGIVAPKADESSVQNRLDGKAWTNHGHLISEVSGLQGSLDGKFDESEHILVSTGPAEAGLPVLTNSNGKLDSSFIDFNSWTHQGSFTPVPGTEYPDTTGLPNGSFWDVIGVTDPYTFVDAGGDLEGRDINNGDFMTFGANGFGILSSSLNPDLYYKLDGSISITANFAGGGFKITNIVAGTVSGDGVEFDQLNTALDLKVDDTQVLTNVPSGALFTDTIYDDSGIIATLDTKLDKAGGNVSGAIILNQTVSLASRNSSNGVTNLLRIDGTDTVIINDSVLPVFAKGSWTFNNVPSSSEEPVLDSDLSTKLYVDTEIAAIEAPDLTDYTLTTVIDADNATQDANTTLNTNKLANVTTTGTDTDISGWVNFSGTAPTSDNIPVDPEDLTRKDYVDGLNATQDAAIALNTAKETNIVHPLVEEAVPAGAVFTDTIYDDTAVNDAITANTTLIGTKEDALPLVTASNTYLKALSVTPGDYEWAVIPAGGVTSVNGATGAVILVPADIGAAPDIHTHIIGDITDLQTTLDGKMDDSQADDYHLKAAFTTESVPNAPVVLDSNGKVSAVQLDVSLFVYQGSFTPVAGTEYPDTTNSVSGDFWVVNGLGVDIGYIFVGGDLIGIEAFDGDLMFWDGTTWSLSTASFNPELYLLKDGSVAMTGNLQMAGSKVTGLVAGTVSGDSVEFDQLTTGLAGKVDDSQVLTDVPGGALFTDTIYDATVIQAEVDLNTAKVGITTAQSDAITANTAKVSNVSTDLAVTIDAVDRDLVTMTSSDGTNAVLPISTLSDGDTIVTTAGLISVAQVTKLNGIAANAQPDMTKADIDALGIDAATVTGFTVGIDVPAGALFTDTPTPASAIDHDLTLNYSATQHIDWTIDSSAISLIHSANISSTFLDGGTWDA